MSDGRSFAEIIVSQLGKPKEPFGLEEFLVLLVLLLGVAAWIMLEYGLGRLFARLWRLTRPEDGQVQGGRLPGRSTETSRTGGRSGLAAPLPTRRL
jgi:hypothetical protein